MTRARPHPAPAPTRRETIAGLVAAAGLPATGRAQAPEAAARTLVAAPLAATLKPAPAKPTQIWAFDGSAVAPILRIKRNEPARIILDNRTPAPLSLHWHGLRGASAMDGVGGFSQPPVKPGERFEYRLQPGDSGTVLIRPLLLGSSSEPAARGLGGMLIVEEDDPPAVDLDLPVLVNDWLLGEDGALRPIETASPAGAGPGRLGSVMTVNGGPPPLTIKVAPGSRVRLRLANACNARIMRLRFDGVRATVVAVDGQPSENFEPVRSQLPFAPGTRYDLMVDMPADAGATAAVTALIGGGVHLVKLVTEGRPRTPHTEAAMLPPNPTLPPAVRLQDARRAAFVVEGGARVVDGKLIHDGLDLTMPWRVNGGRGDMAKPLFSVKRGTPVVIALDNRTDFLQPLHVHGHAFRLLHPLDDGWEPYFLDTVQIPERKRLHIAFIADNPGRWMISSTVLDRFDLGLWGWFEVT